MSFLPAHRGAIPIIFCIAILLTTPLIPGSYGKTENVQQSAGIISLPGNLPDLSPHAKPDHDDTGQKARAASYQVAQRIDVPGAFSLRIIQQPLDNPNYVSNKHDLLTQFRMAGQNGITGLLAHDYLSGKDFYDLKIGQVIFITYQDSPILIYKVAKIGRYKKVNPPNLYSDYIDLATNKMLSTAQVFNLYYRGDHHLTLQTCLAGDGRLDWGLFFILASPEKDAWGNENLPGPTTARFQGGWILRSTSHG